MFTVLLIEISWKTMIQGNIASAINTIQANKVTEEGTQGMQGLMIRWFEAGLWIEIIAWEIIRAIFLYETNCNDLLRSCDHAGLILSMLSSRAVVQCKAHTKFFHMMQSVLINFLNWYFWYLANFDILISSDGWTCARTVLFYLRLAKFTSLPSHWKKISALPHEKKVHGFIEFYNESMVLLNFII